MSRCLLLVHNHASRGSYFRAVKIGKLLAQRGHRVRIAFVSERLKYRPAYRIDSADTKNTTPFEMPGTEWLRAAPEITNTPAIEWAEMPNFTFVNSHQEGWSLFDIFARCRDVFTGKWDLVYAFSHKPDCILPAIVARLVGAKVIVDWADWWGGSEGLYQQCVLPSGEFESLPRPLRWIRRMVFALESFWEPHATRVGHVVTLITSEFLRHPRAPRAIAEKTLVLPTGATVDSISVREKGECRRELNLEIQPDEIVFGYLANFHMAETLLLEAFAKVCKESDRPVRLLVAGAPLEATSPEIHRDIGGRLHHRGWIPFTAVETFLGACDALLLPLNDIDLDRARYPHKLSDYMASDRPIIACDVGATGQHFRDGLPGTITPATPEGFANGMLQFIANPELQTASTRQAAKLNFNWDSLMEELATFIKSKTNLHL